MQQLLHDALLFQFVVIGEAVEHLAQDTRSSAPELPWANIASLRDLIAHEYLRIDIDRVLEIVAASIERGSPSSSSIATIPGISVSMTTGPYSARRDAP